MDDERIEREILGYLSNHPAAQDTVEGIAEWWLLERWIRREAGQVEVALEHLVARGKIAKRTGPDGRAHYRLNVPDA